MHEYILAMALFSHLVTTYPALVTISQWKTSDATLKSEIKISSPSAFIF